jgi:hypothetical protein
MALTLEANYSKKLGLPGYSSHQFSVTVRTELNDLQQVAAESTKLYQLLQSSVDNEIRHSGFLPEGPQNVPINHNGNGNGNGYNGRSNGNSNGGNDNWACSDKQKNLILKIVDDNRLDKKQIEALAQERFGKGVMALNKLEASGLIEELLEQYGDKNSRNMHYNNHRYQQRTGAK